MRDPAGSKRDYEMHWWFIPVFRPAFPFRGQFRCGRLHESLHSQVSALFLFPIRAWRFQCGEYSCLVFVSLGYLWMLLYCLWVLNLDPRQGQPALVLLPSRLFVFLSGCLKNSFFIFEVLTRRLLGVSSNFPGSAVGHFNLQLLFIQVIPFPFWLLWFHAK